MKPGVGNQKAISITLIISMLFYLSSCYSMRETAIDDLEQKHVSQIELNDGTVIDFSDDLFGYAIISGDEVIRILPNGEYETWQLSEIKSHYTEKFDFGRTFVFSFMVVPFGIIALAWLIFQIIGPIDLAG